MTHRHLLGKILIAVGEQLCDDSSSLSRSIALSEEQLFSITRFARILTSPAVQVMYIGDLCEKWNRSARTIQGWIDLGLVRRGHKRKGDTRVFWYASEVDEDSRQLVRLGYLAKHEGGVNRVLERCRRFLQFKDC